MLIVDGKDSIFGRTASFIAKKLLEGEEVALINAERIILSGDKKMLIEKYQHRRRLQHKGTPEYSPKWPRVPYMLVKRMIRGMLPYKTARGRMAYKRLKVYNDDPGLKGEVIKMESPKNIKKYMYIGDLCKYI